MTKFSKHKWWIVTALITAPLAAIAAGVPNVFTPNSLISAAAVNANFTNLADRVTALEAASAKSSATVLTGAIGTITPRTATFTATGANPLLLLISASAFSATANATLDLAIQFDGQIIGHLLGYTNEGGSHKTIATRPLSIATPAAGTHTIGILPFAGTATATDANDYFSATVIELH
jgi:hypothetical protein